MDSIPENGEVHTTSKSVQTETDDESSEPSSEGEESDQYGSSSDESDDDNTNDKKEDNYSSYSSSSDSEGENRQSSSDESSTLSDEDEPKQDKRLSKEDDTTVVHVPSNDIEGKVKKEEDSEQKAEVINKDNVSRDVKEVQTLPPDTHETSIQTTPRSTNSVDIQTSPRSDENKEENDKQNDSTLEKEETLPVDRGVPIENVEKQRNLDSEVKLETTYVQTTVPDMLDISIQTSQRDLRSSSMQTSPRDIRTVIVQTSPRAEEESKPFENVVLVGNVEIQRNINFGENQNSRTVGTQTKPLHKPIENPLHVEKQSRTAETMTMKEERDDTDTQTINEKVDKQTQAQIKRDRPSTPSSYVSPSSSSSRRSSLSLSNVELPDRPSAPEPIVEDSEKTDERSSVSESEIFVDDVPLVPPIVKRSKKKKLSPEKKEDLALLKKLLKHHKLPRKPKKHPLSPDHRRVPKSQQIYEKNKLEKRPQRPKPVQDDSVMCKTRMKTGNNSGRGVSLAAFRLYLYKIS